MQIQDPCECGPPLPLPSLRLFIPPLRLVSAAMWQVVQRGDVHDYGILEEFVTTATESVPELLSSEQKAQLLLGLRARLVLELCRSEQMTDLRIIQLHLDRIRTLISPWVSESCDAEVEMPESNFVELVESLLKDPSEKEQFFQDVFPVEFGPKYDNALQMLMLEFLSRLERLLPIPDLQQTASLLNAVPSALEECVQSVPDPQQLRTLLQYQRKLGQLDSMETLPATFGDCVLSSLFLPSIMSVVIAQEEVELDTQSELMHDCVSLGADGGPGCSEMEQGSASVEGKELSERSANEKQRLVTADDDQGDEITGVELAMDKDPADGELNNEGVSGTLKPSPFQPLKQSKRLQMKEVMSQGGKLLKMNISGSVHQQSLSPMVPPSLKNSRRRFPNSKTCPVCGKTFPRATAMRRHQETHTRDRFHKFKCLKCGKCFRDLYDLKRHQLRVCEKGKLKKDLPYLVSGQNEESLQPSTSELQDPSLSKTTSTLGLSQKEPLSRKHCSLCGRFFARASDKARHMTSHSEERPHQCMNCEKSFKYPYHLKRHQIYLCEKMNQGGLPSEVSHSVGSSFPLAAAEIDTQVSNSQVSLKEMLDTKTCPVCGRILTRTSDMARHLRSHSKERPYHCATCEKSFKYKDTLTKHQLILGHDGIQEDPCQSVDQYLTEVIPESCGGHLVTKDIDTEPIVTPATLEAAVNVSPDPKTCTVCGKTLNRTSEMALHMLSHSNERPYQCVSCQKRFKYRHGLKKHQIYICSQLSHEEASQKGDQNQSGDRPLESSDLLANEEDGAKPSISENQHSSSPSKSSKVYSCSKCEKTFKNTLTLTQHQKTICNGEEIDTATELFKCNECGKEFKGSSSLRIHQRTHNPFYCTDCGRILPNSAALARHKLMHKRIQCTMCEKSFTLLGRLREHYLHQHKFEGPYPCSHCEKTFTQLSYLAMHERIHSGEYPFQCSQCPEKFRMAHCLTIHKRKHTGEKPFLCWKCGKSYRASSELSVHMGTHSEEKPFSCSQCKASYRTKIQLNTHIEQVHIGLRYPCTHCGKEFMKAISLKRHELTHTGERPFPCDVCGKKFITSHELKMHGRYHTGERPYKCEVCGKAFIQSGYLTSHMRLHTGEKPFKCDVCDKGFRFSHHMKRHQRTHTGEKSFQCGDCGLIFTTKKSLKDHKYTHSVN